MSAVLAATAPLTLGELLPYLQVVTGLLAVLIAINTLGPTLRSSYRRTLGRRKDLYSRIGRLGTGAQLAFFEAVLGEPAATRRTVTGKGYVDVPQEGVAEVERDYCESFFITQDYFVQTISDDDGSVLAFSVTTRAKRFNPVFTGFPSASVSQPLWRRLIFRPRHEGLFRVRLGRTRFGEFDHPEFIRHWVGARVAAYSEGHWWGNAGLYQYYVFTASPVGFPLPSGRLLEVAESLGHRDYPYADYPDPSKSPLLDDTSWLAEFRNDSAITTYTVIGRYLSPDHFPQTSYGPHIDDVRTLA